MMGESSKYLLPVLGGAAALTGIGALAAPLFAGGAAAAGGAGLGAAGLTAGSAAMGGELAAATAAPALMSVPAFAAPTVAPTLGAAGAASAAGAGAGLASTLGTVSKGLGLASSGLAPFLQPKEEIPGQRFGLANVSNLRSLAGNNLY